MHQIQLVRHNKAPFGGEQIIKMLAEHLIINLLRRCKAEEPLEPATSVLRKPREKNEEYIVDEIINILSQNLYNNLSLNSISHEIMYSKSYIEKIFKAKIGCGIIIVSVMVLSLAASGGGSSADSRAASSAGNEAFIGDINTLEGWGDSIKANSDGKTITVVMASHPSTDAFKTMEAEFTKLTGIKVVWDIVEETNLKNKQLLDDRSRVGVKCIASS